MTSAPTLAPRAWPDMEVDFTAARELARAVDLILTHGCEQGLDPLDIAATAYLADQLAAATLRLGEDFERLNEAGVFRDLGTGPAARSTGAQS